MNMFAGIVKLFAEDRRQGGAPRAGLLLKMILAAACALPIIISCADYNLLDESKQPAPVTVSIVAVEDSSVTLSWTQSGAVNFKHYAVYMGWDDVVDTTDSLVDTLTFRQDTTKTVNGLLPNTRYYFRVMVVNDLGLVGPGNSVDTTTHKDLASQAIELVGVVDSTDSSLTISWKKNWIDSYIRYQVFMDTTSTVDTTDSAVAVVEAATKLKITGLERGRKYWFRVYLEGPHSLVAASNTVEGRTPDGVPRAVSLTVDSSSVTDSSVAVSWTKSPDDDFLRYILYQDTVSTVDTGVLADSLDARIMYYGLLADTAHVVEGLDADKQYWFTVYVEDGDSLRTASSTVSITTDDGMPEGGVLSVASFTDSSIVLKWTRNSGSDFAGYNVYMANSPTVTRTDSLVAVNTTQSDTTVHIAGLEKLVQYWFRVYVVNAIGNSASSNTVVNYPVILAYDTVSLTDSSVALVWSQSASSTFQAYKLFRSPSPGITDRFTVPLVTLEESYHTSYVDTEVDSGTTWYYRLYHYEVNEENVTVGASSNEIRVAPTP